MGMVKMVAAAIVAARVVASLRRPSPSESDAAQSAQVAASYRDERDEALAEAARWRAKRDQVVVERDAAEGEVERLEGEFAEREREAEKLASDVARAHGVLGEFDERLSGHGSVAALASEAFNMLADLRRRLDVEIGRTLRAREDAWEADKECMSRIRIAENWRTTAVMLGRQRDDARDDVERLTTESDEARKQLRAILNRVAVAACNGDDRLVGRDADKTIARIERGVAESIEAQNALRRVHNALIVAGMADMSRPDVPHAGFPVWGIETLASERAAALAKIDSARAKLEAVEGVPDRLPFGLLIDLCVARLAEPEQVVRQWIYAHGWSLSAMHGAPGVTATLWGGVGVAVDRIDRPTIDEAVEAVLDRMRSGEGA